jgi:type VI secretion system secreted protein Hcp
MTLMVIVIALVGASSGAVAMFLKIDGGDFTGESQDSKHADWIEVDSFDFGISRPGASGSEKTSASIADLRALQVSKRMDKSTPNLLLSVATGKVYPSATLDVCATGTSDASASCFFQIGLKNVSVVSAETSASTDDDRPQEMVSLNFEKITWTYTPMSKDGKSGSAISTGWSMLENTVDKTTK